VLSGVTLPGLSGVGDAEETGKGDEPVEEDEVGEAGDEDEVAGGSHFPKAL
jgi:hypothetical protein